MQKLFIVLFLVVAVGCAKPSTKPAEEMAEPPEAGITDEEIAKRAEGLEEEVIEEITPPEEEGVLEREIAIEEKAKSVFKDVLFDYDKYDIRPDARPTLNTVARFLKENKEINIVVEGHCDERGTNEYNLALGEKRSKAAKEYLASLGVSPDRMIVITYGEEKPSCTEQNEFCWQENRRAHFVIVKSRFQ